MSWTDEGYGAFKTDSAGDTLAVVLKSSESSWVALDVHCELVGYGRTLQEAQALVDAKTDNGGRLKKR